jgi:uncharacterized protein (DUF2252 family)
VESFTLNADGSPTTTRSRPSWVRERIGRFDRKLDPQTRGLKWAFIARSPLSFFQAAPQLFWADFGKSPLLDRFGGGKKTRLWINGNPLWNHFTSFTDASGRLVFDLGKFDDCVVADYQFDLLRLGISLALNARTNRHNPKAVYRMLVEFARSYWREIKSCRWYENVRYSPWDEEQASGSLRRFLSDIRKKLGYPQMLEQWAKAGKVGLKLKTNGGKELRALPKETAKKLEKALLWYAGDLKPWPGPKPRVFEVVDMAQYGNPQGAGSGSGCFWVLVQVKEEGENPYRILEVKQEGEPPALDHLPKKARRKTRELCGKNEALRVQLGTQALARNIDPWLGRLELKDGEYLVREKSPFEETLSGPMVEDGTAVQLGAILARAHCRSKDSFAKAAFEAIKSDKKAFRKLIAEACLAYTAQVEADHQAFSSREKT